MTYTVQLCTGAAVLLVYLAIMLLAATKYIRLANTRWLEAHEAGFRARLRCQGRGDTGELDAAIKRLLHDDRKVAKGVPGRLSDWVGDWVGSREIGRWVRLHEAQRLEILRLPDDVVRARFARAMGQIDELSVVRQSAWLRRWNDLEKRTQAQQAERAAQEQILQGQILQGQVAQGQVAQGQVVQGHAAGSVPLRSAPSASGPVRSVRDQSANDRWRAELSQLMAELYNARDSTYNQLVSLYGKAGLLVFAAYLPVAALLVAGYGPVLLAGFLGGLVSRMQRLVYAQGRPTAYGTSWVPLFLAPLLGALAAWAGLHLLALLQGLGVVSLTNVLTAGEDFRLLPATPLLGVAVLLGFSERFLNRLGEHADKLIHDDQSGQSAAAAGSPAAMADIDTGPTAAPAPPVGHRTPADVIHREAVAADDSSVRQPNHESKEAA